MRRVYYIVGMEVVKVFGICEKMGERVRSARILDERRRASRHDCFLKVDYATCGRGHIESSTRAINISRGGMRFIVSRLVKSGTLLKVRVYSDDGGVVSRYGVVRWTRRAIQNPLLLRDAGIEFIAS